VPRRFHDQLGFTVAALVPTKRRAGNGRETPSHTSMRPIGVP
jgi:hypothetical protein